MSRVYFHTQHDGTAELRGSERAYAGVTCSDLLMCHLDVGYDTEREPSPVRRLLPPGSYLHATPPGDPRWKGGLRAWAGSSIGDEGFQLPDGQHEEPWIVALNTAIVAGSDPIRLLARMHGQCEIHGYINGEDRAWLAEIIDDGRRDKVLRRNQGWEEVAALLRRSEHGRVFMSYSVCEPFPSMDAAGWSPPSGEDDEDWDAWYDLPAEEQWRLSEAEVLKHPTLRLAPDVLATQGFGSGLSAFDLNEILASDPVSL